MYMFLPFLIAFGVVIATILSKGKSSILLWGLLVVVTILSFAHHVTDPLSLSF